MTTEEVCNLNLKFEYLGLLIKIMSQKFPLHFTKAINLFCLVNLKASQCAK